MPQGKLSVTTVEKEGKKSNRYEASGDVRAWDTNTGELLFTFKHDPPRAIRTMDVSPDGLSFITFEDYYSESGRRLQSTTLWDVESKQHRPLPADLVGYAVSIRPTARTLAAAVKMEAGRIGIKLLDSATAQASRLVSIETEDDCRAPLFRVFSGRQAADRVCDIAQRRSALAEILGRGDWPGELASFAAEKNDMFLGLSYSPDGRMLVTANRGGYQGPRGASCSCLICRAGSWRPKYRWARRHL